MKNVPIQVGTYKVFRFSHGKRENKKRVIRELPLQKIGRGIVSSADLCYKRVHCRVGAWFRRFLIYRELL